MALPSCREGWPWVSPTCGKRRSPYLHPEGEPGRCACSSGDGAGIREGTLMGPEPVHLPWDHCQCIGSCFPGGNCLSQSEEFEIKPKNDNCYILQNSEATNMVWTYWTGERVVPSYHPGPSRAGVWTQGLTLAKQAPYHLNHSPSPFCVQYVWARVSWTGLEPWSSRSPE
jgi:hypothetical protein